MTIEEVINRCVVEPSGCVTWHGARDGKGYPHCFHEGRTVRVFRLLYEHLVGPISKDLLHHTCENKACVNPDHLEDVTKREHHRDKHPSRQNSHCKHGHKLEGDNLLLKGRAVIRRRCRICETAKRSTPAYKAWKAAYDKRRNADKKVQAAA